MTTTKDPIFKVTAAADLVMSPVIDGDQPVRLVAGEPVEVSEHQAVHSLGRPDLKVDLPARYRKELEEWSKAVAAGDTDGVDTDQVDAEGPAGE